ncbi:hypothetical protein [Streptomyces sp. DSM 40750]|uniref:hypothetical protein n=1 Tax=Streptomyces sp. DSM 40750 TaxID=2801030 RepID=UPI00214BFE9C|nr:hypothetical protein [Streptomyces sp. DSM 40750]UUU23689.1 hypothetical protein JIX55_27415 [Streptomyces sp. DSM 40750]
MTVHVSESRRRQGPSPMTGECLRPLTRRQVQDRMPELGDLYARTSGGEPWAWNGARTAFLRRLTSEVRRPGFALLIAETTVPSGTTVLTGCAHGFPVRGDGPWWQGLDGYLPESLLRVAGAGRLFAVSGILVGRRVRTENQARDWNLARRLQTRLLTDHAAALGVMLVNRGDVETLEALRSWGWRHMSADARSGAESGAVGDAARVPAVPSYAPCRVLVLR